MGSSAPLDILDGISEDMSNQKEVVRKRSDRVSSLMGQYLLKGWRMLNEYCPACQTILLRQQNGVNYCVTCSEIDKDESVSDCTTQSPVKQMKVAESVIQNLEKGHVGDMKLNGLPKQSKCHTDPGSVNSSSFQTTEQVENRNLLNDLRNKIYWCTTQIVDSNKPTEIRDWSNALKSLSEAAQSVWQFYKISSAH